jgi:hypothetical protein
MPKFDPVVLGEPVFDRSGFDTGDFVHLQYHPGIPRYYCSCCKAIFVFPPPLYSPYRYIVTLAVSGGTTIMGEQDTEEIDVSSLTIQRALDIARNSEGSINQAVGEYLEDQLREIWSRIEDQPESYVLDKDEFALFNFYRDQAPSSSLAQSAVQRFWDNYSNQ